MCIEQDEDAGVEVPRSKCAVTVTFPIARNNEADLDLKPTIADSNVPALLRRRRELSTKSLRHEMLRQVTCGSVAGPNDASLEEFREDVGVEAKKCSSRQAIKVH